ncbi:hypothetical protein SAMN04487926_1089 [Paraburkholderia steynii]|uniref:Uncharacterized protein n=1 Tax=Paraburkholderia steynii TaxID=1245441 RepID=A0A7Z7FIS9_9BURK|nr:hypothetical protein [Paraburkholderia steynii]SDH78169.1 hypothetical protein SAMN04487926_1089 [Paraburkholderia steynii]
MSERIRILAAAARERAFTVPQLAKAAGANTATVRTVLKRTSSDWFAQGKAKNRRGAPSNVYTLTSVGRDAIEAVLQQASTTLAHSLPGGETWSTDEDANLSIGVANELIRRANAFLDSNRLALATALLEQAESTLETAFISPGAESSLIKLAESQQRLVALERRVRATTPHESPERTTTVVGDVVLPSSFAGGSNASPLLLSHEMSAKVRMTAPFDPNGKPRGGGLIPHYVVHGPKPSLIPHWPTSTSVLDFLDQIHPVKPSEDRASPKPPLELTKRGLSFSARGDVTSGHFLERTRTFEHLLPQVSRSDRHEVDMLQTLWNKHPASGVAVSTIGSVTGLIPGFVAPRDVLSTYQFESEFLHSTSLKTFEIVIITQPSPAAREVAGYVRASLQSIEPDAPMVKTIYLDHAKLPPLSLTTDTLTYLLFAIDSCDKVGQAMSKMTERLSESFSSNLKVVLDAASTAKGQRAADRVHARYISHVSEIKPKDLLQQLKETAATSIR